MLNAVATNTEESRCHSSDCCTGSAGLQFRTTPSLESDPMQHDRATGSSSSPATTAYPSAYESFVSTLSGINHAKRQDIIRLLLFPYFFLNIPHGSRAARMHSSSAQLCRATHH